MNDQLGHFTDICHRARCTLGIIHIKLPDKAFPQFHWQGNGRICEVEIRKISDKGRGGNWYEHSDGESLLHLVSAGTCGRSLLPTGQCPGENSYLCEEWVRGEV